MRNKILLAISAFILTCINLTSCLPTNEVEYATDTRVTSFGLDSVNGKYYKFEIDNLNHLIFNRDSMPLCADTILDSIKIDTFVVRNIITSGISDTILNMEKAHDLRGAINQPGEKGLRFRVLSPDGVSAANYYLEIRVHQQDPDSVIWRQKDTFNPAPIEGEIKAVTLGNDLFVLTSETKAYKTSIEANAFGWTELTLTGLPATADITSATCFLDKLYMLTTDGDLYESADGLEWSKNTALSGGIVTLLGNVAENKFYNTLETFCAVRELSGKRYFCATTDMGIWKIGAEVPSTFPTKQICATHHVSSTGLSKTIIVGMPHTTKSATVPWFTMDGTDWAEMSALQHECPAFDLPFITFVRNKFYMYGGSMESVYESTTGIGWYKVKEKFTLPKEFQNHTSYSIVEDKYHAMWVIFGGNGTETLVWRGRLNATAFEIQ